MDSFAPLKQPHSAGALLWLSAPARCRGLQPSLTLGATPSPTAGPIGRDRINREFPSAALPRAGRRMPRSSNGVGSASLLLTHEQKLRGNRQFVYEPTFLLKTCINTSMNSDFEQLFVTQPEIIKISTL